MPCDAKRRKMPCDAKRRKGAELWTAVSGLLALISRAYRNFSLWHHKFIKAAMSAALVDMLLT